MLYAGDKICAGCWLSDQLIIVPEVATDMKKSISSVILRAIALAMSVAAIILGILNAATIETCVALLGVGLFALALDSFLQKSS